MESLPSLAKGAELGTAPVFSMYSDHHVKGGGGNRIVSHMQVATHNVTQMQDDDTPNTAAVYITCLIWVKYANFQVRYEHNQEVTLSQLKAFTEDFSHQLVLR